jgi:hypothetical protein
MTAADLRERILATALANPAVRDVHDVGIYVDASDQYVVAHQPQPGRPTN